VTANRTADDIQRDIEQARVSLASAVDELAARTSPKRIMNDAKQTLLAKARTPAGKAVVGGTGALVALLVVRRLRRRRRAG
jgi:hypothetical protein